MIDFEVCWSSNELQRSRVIDQNVTGKRTGVWVKLSSCASTEKTHCAIKLSIAIDLFKTLYTSVKEKDFLEKSCISDSTCRVACCCQSTIEKGQLLFYYVMLVLSKKIRSQSKILTDV